MELAGNNVRARVFHSGDVILDSYYQALVGDVGVCCFSSSLSKPVDVD